MAEMLLCCGKVCSGKSTFAERMEKDFGFFNFSADEWMLRLYDPVTDRGVFVRQLNACKELIISISNKLLDHSQDVVLDFGFWKKTERSTLRDEIARKGHRALVVYFPIEYATQLEFMKNRQSVNPRDNYHFTEDDIKVLNQLFEEPDATETVVRKEEYLLRLLKSRG
jgi:predicted kinase